MAGGASLIFYLRTENTPFNNKYSNLELPPISFLVYRESPEGRRRDLGRSVWRWWFYKPKVRRKRLEEDGEPAPVFSL